jgi:cytidylate kinase
MNNMLYAVTISHLLGSGGAVVGQKLSDKLGIPFIDREVLKEVSRRLNFAEQVLQQREERLQSFWESFSHMVSLIDPAASFSSASYVPTDQELFLLESETIGRIAEKRSAIFIGRCARFILRNHPHHVSILIHADIPDRIKRLSELYKISEAEASKLVHVNDRERSAYIRAFAKENLFDARLYDLSVNVSRIGLDKAVEHIVDCVNTKIQSF